MKVLQLQQYTLENSGLTLEQAIEQSGIEVLARSDIVAWNLLFWPLAQSESVTVRMLLGPNLREGVPGKQ